MKKSIFARLISASIFLGIQGLAQAPSGQQIVDQQFPQNLFIGDTTKLDRVSCFTVFDSLPDGTPKTIMAAYSNDFQGSVRAIQHQADGSYQVIDEPSGFDFGGPHCTVDLKDVDGDGINEVRVSFASFRVATSDWIFKWDGSHLRNIGPTSQSGSKKLRSLLSLTDFVDVYHDGTLQVLSVSGCPSPEDGHFDAPNFLYRLVSGTYVLDAPNLYVQSFVRKTGSPIPQTDSFDTFEGSSGPYVLKVINGLPNGGHRVSSAHVLLNGTEVIGPSKFDQQVGLITTMVNHLNPRSNQIQVQLEGAPDGEISIVVEDHSPQFATGPQ
jgi:hypothetical protein